MCNSDDDDEVMLNVLRCQLTHLGQVVTNAEVRFNNSLRPRKPEGSLGRTAQDGHLDFHTAPELRIIACSSTSFQSLWAMSAYSCKKTYKCTAGEQLRLANSK